MDFSLADGSSVSSAHRHFLTQDTCVLANLKTTPSLDTVPHNQLKIATIFVQGHPLKVLFDDGAQLNTISQHIVKKLQLSTQQMNPPTKFMFPDSGIAVITEYVPCLSILFNALQLNHQSCNLYFNPDFLVLNSYIDMIIGIAFLRYHRIMTYFCQDTLIYILTTGHTITIPLHVSNLAQQCTNKFCPFLIRTDPCLPLPQQQPFVPPRQHFPLDKPLCASMHLQQQTPTDLHKTPLQFISLFSMIFTSDQRFDPISAFLKSFLHYDTHYILCPTTTSFDKNT